MVIYFSIWLQVTSFEIELRFLDWTEYSVWHKINLICSTRKKTLPCFEKCYFYDLVYITPRPVLSNAIRETPCSYLYITIVAIRETDNCIQRKCTYDFMHCVV